MLPADASFHRAPRSGAQVLKEVLRTGETIFDELRNQWEEKIGEDQVKKLEELLTELVGTAASTTP